MNRRPTYYCSCEHAGNVVPPEYRPLFAGKRKLLASHRGVDIGIRPVAEQVSKALGVPLASQTITRLLVEANRSLHHPSLFSSVTKDLPGEIKRDIIARYYDPHRQRVEREIARIIKKSGRVVHLGFHSFTPVWKGKRRKVDIGLLYDPARPMEKQFCRTLRTALLANSPDLIIRMNNPYRGNADGLTTSLRKNYSDTHYLGIELEINQQQLTTPKSRRETGRLLAQALRGMFRHEVGRFRE